VGGVETRSVRLLPSFMHPSAQKLCSRKFAGKVPKDSPNRGCTPLFATLGFSDRHGPTEGENAMDIDTRPYALAREEGQALWFLALSC
jgi:hypothetical protein